MSITAEGFICKLIRDAKRTDQMTAAFHAAVLDYREVFEHKTGEELRNLCLQLGVPASYATEAKKMLAVNRYRKNRPPSLDSPNVVY